MSSLRTQIALAITIIGLVASACGGAEEDAGSAGNDPATTVATATESETTPTTEALPEITLPPRAPTDYAEFTAQKAACGAEAPQLLVPMTFDAPGDQGLDPGAVVTATIVTSCGDIVVELDPGIAPDTVNSFVFLARSGYFNGSVSHRLIPGFVLQAGDPSATGSAGPGYTIQDELPGAGFLYQRGALAMANSGPNSSGSQFFIVLADAPLDPTFSYFGTVVDGFETLDRIVAQVPLGPNRFGETSVPLETLYIEQIAVASQ